MCTFIIVFFFFFFRITGFEGQGLVVPKENHRINYPENLKLYVYPRGDLTDFPSPDKDTTGVPSQRL